MKQKEILEIFRPLTECEKKAEEIISAYGQLCYAYQHAIHGYSTVGAHIKAAIKHLNNTGADPEDLEGIINPLREIESGKLHPVSIASHIDTSQEELIAFAPRYIAASCKAEGRDK